MAKGFIYLAAVMDWHTRKVPAWRVSVLTEFTVRCTFLAMQEAIIAVMRNPRDPKLPFSMGWTSAEAKRTKASQLGRDAPPEA